MNNCLKDRMTIGMSGNLQHFREQMNVPMSHRIGNQIKAGFRLQYVIYNSAAFSYTNGGNAMLWASGRGL
ncbi:hypothetical protein ACH3XW_47195 [Acanthocheilonema viteae]